MGYKFTTIINKEGKWYVAHCVELGVVTQGRTAKEAEENIKEAVALYLEGYPKMDIKKLLPGKPPVITRLEVASRG